MLTKPHYRMMLNKKSIKKQNNIVQIHMENQNQGEMSLERQAQVNSVLRIIRESVEKLKISLILPQILKNPTTLRQHFNNTEYDYCNGWLYEYKREKATDTMDGLPSPPHLNYHLINIIEILYNSFHMFKCFQNWLDDLGSEDISLLHTFQLLENITEQRLNKSALSELNKEKEIHEVYHENEVLKKTIKVVHNQLRTQRNNFRWKFVAKKAVIHKYEESLAIRKYDNNIKIKQEIVKSSHKIQQILAASVAKQNNLNEELEQTKLRYEKLLKENCNQEELAKNDKNQLRLQLQGLIKKFDQSIGDKIKENMFLQEEYEIQKQLLDEFMIEYIKEEAEYDRVLRAKENEEKRQHEQKILLFMMNRAARVVQKHWRKFRKAQKKAAKKGKGRGKSKKK